MKNRPVCPSPLKLAPAQAEALQFLEYAIGLNPFAHLWAASGMGKTTVLRALHQKVGGGFVAVREFVKKALDGAPDGLEESFYRALGAALKKHPIVIVDDVGELDLNAGGCGHYPRPGWWNAVMRAVAEMAERLGRRLVLGSAGNIPHVVRQRSYGTTIDRFKADDYAVLLQAMLGPIGATLDAKRIHRFAPRMDGHDFRMACQWMKATRKKFNTEQFIDYLRSQRLTSNVNLEEVQAVDLRTLIGVDDVIRSLETYIALPLENDEMATKLGLRPKRGVLLHGPPGTGKTTVGRALAHRLKGKFFLIDGTFISGSQNFYGRVHEVFEAAKQNAPAVIFIDDADAIFQNNEEQGLYRYLLTMLDGLESEGQAQVCVMMTAMDLGDLPPALVRSGRVELWLGMRLPDAAARERILLERMQKLPPELAAVDCTALAAVTDGLTGADLKRCVEDAKAIYAYAALQNSPRENVAEYFQEAIATIRANKDLYRHAQESAQKLSARVPGRASLAMAQMLAQMNGGERPDGQ